MTDAVEALLVGVLDEILAELKAINAKLATTAQPAKVEIKTSTRGVDVTVVAYESTTMDGLDDAGNRAADEYRRLMHQFSDQAMQAFANEATRRGIKA